MLLWLPGMRQPRPEIQAQNLGVLVSSHWSPMAAPGGRSDFASRLTLLFRIGAELWEAFAAAVSNYIMGALREAAAGAVGPWLG